MSIMTGDSNKKIMRIRSHQVAGAIVFLVFVIICLSTSAAPGTPMLGVAAWLISSGVALWLAYRTFTLKVIVTATSITVRNLLRSQCLSIAAVREVEIRPLPNFGTPQYIVAICPAEGRIIRCFALAGYSNQLQSVVENLRAAIWGES